MTDIKKGDRVRVALEGVVQRTFDNGNLWLESSDFGTAIDGTHVISVEKIEPPVEVFKPGDVVRSLATGSYWYLATNGYVRMTSADFPEPVEFYEYTDSTEFTSDEYEKVDL